MPRPPPAGRSKDPWQTWQLDSVDVPTRTALRTLYNMTSQYLARGGFTGTQRRARCA
jgi:hypothetical protein